MALFKHYSLCLHRITDYCIEWSIYVKNEAHVEFLLILLYQMINRIVTRLRIRIRDPVPFWPVDLGYDMGKKCGSGSGIRIRDLDPGSGSGIWIRDPDPEWTTWSDPGSGANIPDPQNWLSVTLSFSLLRCLLWWWWERAGDRWCGPR